MEREKGKALDQQALITLPARPHLGIFSSIVESDAGGLKHNNAWKYGQGIWERK